MFHDTRLLCVNILHGRHIPTHSQLSGTTMNISKLFKTDSSAKIVPSRTDSDDEDVYMNIPDRRTSVHILPDDVEDIVINVPAIQDDVEDIVINTPAIPDDMEDIVINTPAIQDVINDISDNDTSSDEEAYDDSQDPFGYSSDEEEKVLKIRIPKIKKFTKLERVCEEFIYSDESPPHTSRMVPMCQTPMSVSPLSTPGTFSITGNRIMSRGMITPPPDMFLQMSGMVTPRNDEMYSTRDIESGIIETTSSSDSSTSSSNGSMEEIWKDIITNNGGEYAISRIMSDNKKLLVDNAILAEAPSDTEKGIYKQKNSYIYIFFRMISLISLCIGTWLIFKISTISFYWYGVPTALIVGYVMISTCISCYDTNPDKKTHEEIINNMSEILPCVDVFLPVCGESFEVIENTFKHIKDLDWPNLSIYVLDDGGKKDVEFLSRRFGFEYICRPDRPSLKKAGNLRHAFTQSNSEFITIFDADFCPRRDFLKETVPYFKNEKIAIVQTPQFFRRREEQTWVEKGAGVTQEIFYRLVQPNRNKLNASICVGTCGVYRREALEPFGGTATVDYSEDVNTGFNCMTLGYDVEYVPVTLAMGTCPDSKVELFTQQYKWVMGSTTLFSNPSFWKSSLNWTQKLCYISGMCYYFLTALLILIGPLPGLFLVIFRPNYVFWFNIGFSIPSIVFSYVIMKLWCKQKYDFSCARIRVIQYLAHIFAIKDKIMGKNVQSVPTREGGSLDISTKFDSAMKLIMIWMSMYMGLIIVFSTWQFPNFPFYHFVPTMVVALYTFCLNISVLF